MMRESKPSIGADCHWSRPLPCGIPSTTSTLTTVRASSFSAIRCAVVAPTLPAPTTVILLTIWVGIIEECAKVTRASHAIQLRELLSRPLVTARAGRRHAFAADRAAWVCGRARHERWARAESRYAAAFADTLHDRRTDMCANVRPRSV